MNRRLLLLLSLSVASLLFSQGKDEIYWETPAYLSRLKERSQATQYVYHLRQPNFQGNWIVPLNRMREMQEFTKIYQRAILKYKGREDLCREIIPPLNCLWNDVVFLSPLHPHKHYEEYKKIGFLPTPIQFFKIPIEVLANKRIAVFKWSHNDKYPADKQIPTYEEITQDYCALDFFHYQEMDDLPEDTRAFYAREFDPVHPEKYPRFNWYRIPHILCLDPIDVSDPRISIIQWEDCPEGKDAN